MKRPLPQPLPPQRRWPLSNSIPSGGQRITVCLTGPESSGKTTLARALAQSLALPLVLESARSLLVPGNAYTASDLREIAVAQQQAEYQAVGDSGGAIVDTDATVIAVWWRERFAASAAEPWPPWLSEQLQQRRRRSYLLCAPDMPWEPDPLRESPDDRERLFAVYERLLRHNPYPWFVVQGSTQARLASALAVLD